MMQARPLRPQGHLGWSVVDPARIVGNARVVGQVLLSANHTLIPVQILLVDAVVGALQGLSMYIWLVAHDVLAVLVGKGSLARFLPLVLIFYDVLRLLGLLRHYLLCGRQRTRIFVVVGQARVLLLWGYLLLVTLVCDDELHLPVPREHELLR